jgi:hypothetical protein
LESMRLKTLKIVLFFFLFFHLSLMGDLSKVNVAITYLKNQEEDKAFRVFLEALNTHSPQESFIITYEEEELYKKALENYLDRSEYDKKELSKKIQKEFSYILSEHPEYHLLGFFFAIADANLENYEHFFKRFYESFLKYPDHFLVFKTKAIIHYKLFEKASTEDERSIQSILIYKNALEALNRYSKDHSLSKLAIAFAPEEKKTTIIRDCLNKILMDNIILPRADISFYLQHAISSDNDDLAEQLINRAQSWYQYSRTIDAAKKVLEENKSKVMIRR